MGGLQSRRFTSLARAATLGFSVAACQLASNGPQNIGDPEPVRVSAALESELRAVFADPAAAAAGMTIAGMLDQTASAGMQLANRLEARYPGARERADSVAAGVEYMLDLWTPGDGLPAEYRHDLARNVELLRLADSSEDADDAHLLWSEVMDDMEVKIEHCQALGTGLGGLVAVRAHTLREMAADSGWQVVYLRKVFEVLPDAQPQPFPRLSSPAEDSLAPGRYWIWARRPGTSASSERVLLRVGAGRSLVDVDLPLPPARSP